MAIRNYNEDGKKLYEVYINGLDAQGVRVQKKRKGIESLRRAESVEFELKREMAQLKERKASYRWNEWFEECLRRMKFDKRPSTIQNYERMLNKWITPLWRERFIHEISKSDVYKLIFEEVNSSLTAYTKRTILRLTSRIFQLAVEEGILDRNPCVGITVKVAEVDQKVLTNVEVEIFLREAKLAVHKFYPIWVLALLTGMRSGELFALRFTDIDLDAKTISVTRQWTSKNGFCSTKTRKSRIVPISDDLLAFLKERKIEVGSESEFVLPRLRDWDQGEQARITRAFCAFIGVTPVKFHDLRATFITNLLARGEPLARVMSIVGHSELKTTNGYLRKSGVDVQGATECLGYKVPKSDPAKILSFRRESKPS